MEHHILALCLSLVFSLVLSQTSESHRVSARLNIGSTNVPLDQIYDESTQEYMENASVSIQFGAQKLTLNLERAVHITHDDFKAVHIDQHGTETEVFEHDLHEHCTYHGSSQDDPLVRALFIACGGRLRGRIQTKNALHNLVLIGDDTYAELPASETQNASALGNPCTSGMIPSDTVPDSSVQPITRRSLSQTREIGVVLYIDASMQALARSRKWTVNDLSRLAVTHANIAYNSIGFEVRLVGIVTLTESFTPDKLASSTTFKYSTMTHQDYAFVIMAPGGFAGRGQFRSMCHHKPSKGYISFVSTDPALWSNVLSHEMGHSIGARDDYTRLAQCCPGNRCIMGAASAADLQWSKCTKDEITAWLAEEPRTCLGSINCVFGAWTSWTASCHEGKYQTRTRPVKSGPCQPSMNFRVATACKGVTAVGEDHVDASAITTPLSSSSIVAIVFVVIIVVAIVAGIGFFFKKKGIVERP